MERTGKRGEKNRRRLGGGRDGGQVDEPTHDVCALTMSVNPTKVHT